MMSELTINEVAHIAEVPARSVEKAIETGIMKPVKRRAVFSRARARFLEVDAVCYFAAVGHSKFLNDIPVRRKKALFKAIREMPGPSLEPLDLEPGLHLDLPMIAGPKMEAAHADLASGRGRRKGAAAPGPDDRTRRQGRETIPRRPRNRNASGGRQEPGSAAGGKTGTGMETTNGKKTGRDQRDDRNRTMKP